jgi:hypothetical protein
MSSPEKNEVKTSVVEKTPECKIPEVEVPNKEDATWDLGEDQLTALLMSKKKKAPAPQKKATTKVSLHANR